MSLLELWDIVGIYIWLTIYMVKRQKPCNKSEILWIQNDSGYGTVREWDAIREQDSDDGVILHHLNLVPLFCLIPGNIVASSILMLALLRGAWYWLPHLRHPEEPLSRSQPSRGVSQLYLGKFRGSFFTLIGNIPIQNMFHTRIGESGFWSPWPKSCGSGKMAYFGQAIHVARA